MADMETEVRRDIRKCNDVLEKQDISEAKRLEETILGAYSDYINGIKDRLDIMLFHPKKEVDYLGDIEKLKRKLELFLANECIPTKHRNEGEGKISINNNNLNYNSNINNNEINLSLVFEQLRQDIINDEHLSLEETEDILAKVNEIEEINNSDISKKEKWLKLRGLLQWLGTKGLDIGLKLLPVIVTILKQN